MIEFFKQPRTIYPSVFRVMIGLVLLVDLIFTFPSGEILFNSDYTSYSQTGNFIAFLRENYILFYISFALILILFILGIGNNITSLLVYIFYFLTHFISPVLLNWGDTILKFTLLYFVFVDSYKYFSIRKSKKENVQNYLSQLAVWSIILHLFLVYLSNGFYKIQDTDWQQGLAPFYSFSQFPGFKTSVFYPVLSNEILSKIISYLIVAQQLAFIPLVIWKRTRYFAMLTGVVVHLIMFWQFGLWKFEIIMILLYGFLLGDKDLRRVIPKKHRKKLI